MARISNNSPQKAIGDVSSNEKKPAHWALAFFSVNSTAGNSNDDDNGGGVGVGVGGGVGGVGGGGGVGIGNGDDNRNNKNNGNKLKNQNKNNNNLNSNYNNNNDSDSNSVLLLRRVLSRAFEHKGDDVTIDTTTPPIINSSNSSNLTSFSSSSYIYTTPPTTSSGFTISSPRVVHSSHTLNLRSEEDGDNNFPFYRKSPGLVPGSRPTYHNESNPAVFCFSPSPPPSSSSSSYPYPSSPSSPSSSSSFSSTYSPRTGPQPITAQPAESTNSLLDRRLDQCLAPIPPSLWGSRQRHACKHADTFTPGHLAAALTSDGQHHLHLHHIYREPSPLDPALDFDKPSAAAAAAAALAAPNPDPEIPSPYHETTPDCCSSSFTFSSSSSPRNLRPLLLESTTTNSSTTNTTNNTTTTITIFSSPSPSPSPSSYYSYSSLSNSPSDSHNPPAHDNDNDNDELITPCLEPALPPAVHLQDQSRQHPALRAISCNISSLPTERDILAEHSCAALEADPPLPPHCSSPLLPSPTSSHSEQDPSPPTLDDAFTFDFAMPKQRSSDSGASSRTRPEMSRPASTATTSTSTTTTTTTKAPSSPHSISRMFSTKIRGLLHTRDRRASSPLSPVASIVDAHAKVQKASSVSVPSSPRTVQPPPPPPPPVVHPVHPGTMVQAPTEDYGLIPIGNPFPQNGKDYTASVVEPRSGHSSYMSMDSPTTRTESTCQDSSTSTESTGIPSNRNSFMSLQEERRRSGSPESPITPDGDYRFARSTPAKTDTMDSTDYQYEDAHDDSRSQEVLVFLDERSEVVGPPIPSVQIEAATPTVLMNKHSSHFSIAPSSRAPHPGTVSRSRSASPAASPVASPSSSPAARRAPSFAAASIREECPGGRETPSFLAPRPAPIPIPSSGLGPGSVKPTMRPAEGGPKLLRSSTMSSRSPAAPSWNVPSSLIPGGRSDYVLRPSTATRPGTSFSTMSGRSMHPSRMPVSPRDGNFVEMDETATLGAPSPSASTFNPDKAPSPPRGKPGSLMSASVPHEIAIPPAYDARSFKTAPASPTATSDYSFTVGLSPKRIPDDMQMCPIVFHTENSDADVCIPVFLPLPSPVAEPQRSRTVSLRRAFTRLNSHVNKRGTPPHITPDIISRPSTATKNGIPTHAAEPPATILEYDNPENLPPTSRTRANSSGTQPSGGSSFSRWKSVHTRSSSNPSNPPPPAYSPPAVPAVPTLTPGVPQPIALTDDERSEIARMPGTIFLKTAIKNDGPDGELTIQEHRLKPRKGMQGSGLAGKCRFCRRGPFPNMWVCLDSCGFVMCRICANESVQGGEAELF